MTKAYDEFNHSDDNEEDEDDDIGALGSILSWDEDEEGGVGASGGAASLSDRDSMHHSALPDLVSFNLKDGGLTSSYLQQLATGSGGTIDPSALNLLLPPRANAQNNPSNPPREQPEQKLESTSNVQKQQQEGGGMAVPTGINTADAQAQQQEQLQQQQQQIQQQQQQIQQQQQQIQQHHQLQQQLQQQQQLAGTAPNAQQTNSNPQNHAQQVAQQQAVVAASIPPHLQGAFSLLQQNAILAQQAQNAMVIPGVAQQQAGQDQRNDQQQQQQQQQQAPQFIDPNAFLRQLQVAQLQQQFNAVQQAAQAQAQAQNQQQVMGAGAGHMPSTLQQPMQYPGQVAMVQPQAATAGVQAGVPIAKKPNAASQKPRAQTTEKVLSQAAIAKASLVSASDTDGELSMKLASKNAKKPPATRKKTEIDMSNMTPEEKAKANRDRNREHARNTRLRKKAYLEKLKTTVDELCRERDTLVSERAGAANILVEMNNTRTEVLMSFFALRSANEKRRELWSSILDESCFACVMPVTPYRSFPASEVQVSKCQRTILGIDGMMSDTASLHVLLNSLVDRSRFPNATIMFRYTLVTEEAVVAGNQMMARWVMTTLNATQCGARNEVAKQGMLCCKFNSAHKIIGLELMFDVMALMLQLKQAAGSDTFSVIPNTVQTCQRSFDKPMMMILAEEPYTIVQVNKLWEDMSGYKAEDVVGKTSNRILEGEQTDSNAVEVLMNEIRFKRPASAMILHYKKTGERFHDFFLAYPLSTDSRITHYLIFTTHVGHVVDGNSIPTSSSMPVEEKKQQVPISAAPSQQQNFFAQNLQANFNAAKSQQFLQMPTVMSSTDSSASAPGILPPNLAASQNPNGSLPQHFPPVNNALKRAHANEASDLVESRKQQKTDGQGAATTVTAPVPLK